VSNILLFTSVTVSPVEGFSLLTPWLVFDYFDLAEVFPGLSEGEGLCQLLPCYDMLLFILVLRLMFAFTWVVIIPCAGKQVATARLA
jgi:hypothetical protein